MALGLITVGAALLGALAAPAHAWSDPASGAMITLPTGWAYVPVTLPLDGALVQATHAETGGGLIVRVQPYDPSALPANVQVRVGDVEAALSADRFAAALAASQKDGSADRTVYLGLSDTAGARVGRWVFTDPGAPATATSPLEPARLWWHATWRVSTGWAQLVAWVPFDQSAAFIPAVRAVETSTGRVDGQAPPAALLWRTDSGCDGPASVDRMAAIAASARFAASRTSPGAVVDRVAELGTLGTLIHDVDACVEKAAKEADACEVWERPSETPRSERAQKALTACLDKS